MCIRKFKRRADLARHIKRHQGIRPYECSAKSCPLAPDQRFFFRADARQRHWKAYPSCEDEFYLTEAGMEWYVVSLPVCETIPEAHLRLGGRKTAIGRKRHVGKPGVLSLIPATPAWRRRATAMTTTTTTQTTMNEFPLTKPPTFSIFHYLSPFGSPAFWSPPSLGPATKLDPHSHYLRLLLCRPRI